MRVFEAKDFLVQQTAEQAAIVYSASSLTASYMLCEPTERVSGRWSELRAGVPRRGYSWPGKEVPFLDKEVPPMLVRPQEALGGVLWERMRQLTDSASPLIDVAP